MLLPADAASEAIGHRRARPLPPRSCARPPTPPASSWRRWTSVLRLPTHSTQCSATGPACSPPTSTWRRTGRRQHRLDRLLRRQGAPGRPGGAHHRPRCGRRSAARAPQDAADVTDQLVDLDIRIDVERRDRDRPLPDPARRRDRVPGHRRDRASHQRADHALEQLLASQRNLDNRVDRSTLTIQLQYEAPVAEVVATEDDSIEGIGDAWRAGWDVFVGALFAIGFVLAVAAPFLVTAVVVLALVWLVTRRGRRGGRDDRPTVDTPAAERPCRSSHPGRAARRAQPAEVSTRSLTLPSGNANGARTPAWARTSGSASGPNPVVPGVDSVVQRCHRWAGSRRTPGVARRGSRRRRAPHRPARSRHRRRPALRRVPAEWAARSRTTRRSNAIGVGIAVGQPERIVGIVDCRGVRLVTDRPLRHRIVAGVLRPERLTLDDERVRSHGHREVGDVQQRATRSRQRRPVPRRSTDDPMPGDQPHRPIGDPRGEDPLLDRRVDVSAFIVPVEMVEVTGHIRQTTDHDPLPQSRLDHHAHHGGRRQRPHARDRRDASHRRHPGGERRPRRRRDLPPQRRRRASLVRGWTSRSRGREDGTGLGHRGRGGDGRTRTRKRRSSAVGFVSTATSRNSSTRSRCSERSTPSSPRSATARPTSESHSPCRRCPRSRPTPNG